MKFISDYGKISLILLASFNIYLLKGVKNGYKTNKRYNGYKL